MRRPNKPADEKREEVLFKPLFRTTRGYYVAVLLLLSIVLWAAFAFINQVVHGLGVTGLNRPVYWGIYVTNFIFFIGISHAGTLISAILRVTHAGWRRPITRAAEAITVFALMIGPLNIIFDLGRPDRMFHVFQYGRFQSPLLWDVMAIGTYFTGSIIYLLLPMIPDIAAVRDRLPLSDKRRRVYQILSLGWKGTEEQKKRLNRAIAIMAIAIIPIAVSVHTVVSWVLAMNVQPMWHSAIFGPYFVVGAIFSGIATLLIAMAILRKTMHLEAYLTPKHFRYLGFLLLAMSVFWLYFTANEYMTTLYGNEPSHMAVFASKVWGQYAWLFWAMVLFNFTLALPFLIFSGKHVIAGCVIASIMINIGMWLERYTIIVPTLVIPRLPFEAGTYAPTWVEWSITAGEFAALALLYLIFVKVFPIIAMWEVKEAEEEEHARKEAPVVEPEPKGLKKWGEGFEPRA